LKKDWGFTNSQVGFVMALQGINFIGAIVWTSAADRTGKHKWLLAGATMMAALFFVVNNLPKILGYKFATPFQQMLFTFIALGFSWFFQSAMFPLLDSAMIGMLAKNPKFTKDQFGNQRLFGSPAHVIGTFLGAFFQAFGNKSVYLYQINAFVCASIFVFLVVIAVPNVDAAAAKSFGHHGAQPEKKATTVHMGAEQEGQKDAHPVVRLLTNIPFLFFMLFVVSAGLLANTLTIFQQILVSDRHKAIAEALKAKGQAAQGTDHSTTKAALTRIPAAASEIVVYLTAKHITRALGIYWLLIFSQIAGLLRIFGYALIEENTYFPYFLEITKGLNSGFIVSAGVRIASDIALPGTATTAQGLFSGTYKGISISLAGIGCGIILLFLNQNIKSLFFVIGGFSLFTTFGFFLKFLLVDRVIGFPGFPRKEKAHVIVQEIASSPSETKEAKI
jgi:hypothetical protein